MNLAGNHMAIGENLKRLRREKSLTQGELSKLTGIELNHISKMERNDSDPKLSTIYKLMRALNCTADALLMNEQNTSLESMLTSCLERTKDLPPRAKTAIIDVIDHYCIAYGMKSAFKGKHSLKIMTGAPPSLIEDLPDINELEG